MVRTQVSHEWCDTAQVASCVHVLVPSPFSVSGTSVTFTVSCADTAANHAKSALLLRVGDPSVSISTIILTTNLLNGLDSIGAVGGHHKHCPPFFLARKYNTRRPSARTGTPSAVPFPHEVYMALWWCFKKLLVTLWVGSGRIGFAKGRLTAEKHVNCRPLCLPDPPATNPCATVLHPPVHNSFFETYQSTRGKVVTEKTTRCMRRGAQSTSPSCTLVPQEKYSPEPHRKKKKNSPVCWCTRSCGTKTSYPKCLPNLRDRDIKKAHLSVAAFVLAGPTSPIQRGLSKSGALAHQNCAKKHVVAFVSEEAKLVTSQVSSKLRGRRTLKYTFADLL